MCSRHSGSRSERSTAFSQTHLISGLTSQLPFGRIDIDILHGRDMQGWHLPAAPYIFPDMVLVFACSALTSNITAIFVLYQALYYGLLLAVLMAILRGLGFPRRESFIIGGLSVTFLLAAHFEPVYVNRSLPMFHPGNHMGCLLVGLGVIAFILRAVRNGYGWLSAALFAAVCVLSGFSDQLLFVQCFVPVCVAALLLGVQWAVDWPARRALIPDLVGRDLTQSAIVLESLSMSLTRVVGASCD